MPTTLIHKIAYPLGTVAPNIPVLLQTLAESVEAALSALQVKPFGHLGKTGGFQGGGNAMVQTFTAAQVTKGGMVFDDVLDCLVVPKAGLYRLTVQGMWSGGASASNIAVGWKNTTSQQTGAPATGPKPDGADQRYTATASIQLAAGDKIGMTQTMGGGVSSWGTNGYDGTYLELEWIQP